MRFDVRRIRPAKFRLLFLLVLGVPFFYYGFFVSIAGPIGSPEFFGAWAWYTCAIYALMVSTVGLSQFTRWLGGIALLAVATVGPAAMFYYVLTELLGIKITGVSGEPFDQEAWSKHLTLVGLAIVSTIPYAIFCVNCFSAAGLAEALASRSRGRGRAMAHPVTVLRTVQHLTEVLPQLVPVWREEFPSFLRPRFADDNAQHLWHVRTFRRAHWIAEALWHWSTAMLVLAFEPLPIYCHMIEVHFAVHSSEEGPPSE